MLTLSRISSDIILFSTQEFGYLKLADDISTGSSIMPQKKNPDVLELIKANTSLVLGYENIIKNTIKDLPSGYNRETQIIKGHIIKSFNLTIDSVNMMSICIRTLKVNKEKCLEEESYFAKKYLFRSV